MEKPITIRKIKYWWGRDALKVKCLLLLNVLIWGIVAIRGYSIYFDLWHPLEAKIEGLAGVLKDRETREHTKLCGLKEVTCRDTGDILIDTLDGTPMEGAIEPIRNASRYYGLPVELFLGIAYAESSFRNFVGYNPYGIGVGGLIKYSSLEHSTNGFGQLLRYYYFNEGRITPEQLVVKYVGYYNKTWIENVKKYYNPNKELTIKYKQIIKKVGNN